MPILTAADRYTYFPASRLTDEQLEALILQAQVMAEGPLGADRTLEPVQVTESLYMAGNLAQLGYLPILSTPAPVIEIRAGAGGSGFGQNDSIGEWRTLEAEEYEIDTTLGSLRVKQGVVGLTAHGYFPPYQYPYSYSGGVSNPLEHSPDSQVRATYQTGFDFTADTAETRRIKAALAAVVEYLSSNTFKGIEEIQTVREGRVRYVRTQGYAGAFGVGPGQIPEALMLPFQRYKVRSVGML